MKMPKTYLIIGGSIVIVSLGVFIYYKKKKTKITSSFDLENNSKGIHIKPISGIATEPDWNQPFDQNYKQEVETYLKKQVKVLDEMTALRYAKKIKEAKGRFNDDEKVIEEIFGKLLLDKIQISQLSKAFWKRYKKDLWKYLTSFLSHSELTQYIRKPIRNLPNYRT